MQSKHTQQQWRQRDVEGSWILCKSVWTQSEQGFRLQRQKCDSLNLNCLFSKRFLTWIILKKWDTGIKL